VIKIKRIYDPPSGDDGKRVLIDRLWPRGISKDEAQIDEWLKEIAPSDELRKWFGHDPGKWKEFRKRYTNELTEKKDLLGRLAEESKEETLTLLFAAKDTAHSNAAVIRELLSGKKKA
jgi:uncharacterized protein YeaO (DUF488 family)